MSRAAGGGLPLPDSSSLTQQLVGGGAPLHGTGDSSHRNPHWEYEGSSSGGSPRPPLDRDDSFSPQPDGLLELEEEEAAMQHHQLELARAGAEEVSLADQRTQERRKQVVKDLEHTIIDDSKQRIRFVFSMGLLVVGVALIAFLVKAGSRAWTPGTSAFSVFMVLLTSFVLFALPLRTAEFALLSVFALGVLLTHGLALASTNSLHIITETCMVVGLLFYFPYVACVRVRVCACACARARVRVRVRVRARMQRVRGVACCSSRTHHACNVRPLMRRAAWCAS
ncbi:hypothetical protein EON62_00635 [archaeon]|nr:MAG: hypothetical protein EON62_00635 [archaeon]